MTPPKTRLLVPGILSILLFLPVRAQVAAPATPTQLIVQNLEFVEIPTPEYSVRVRGSNRSDGRKTWLQVECMYATQPKWLDEVTFTFYVALKAKSPEDVGPGGTAVNLFSGSVTYQNVGQGRHVANMYMDPQTLERYGEVTHAAVLVTVNGTEVGRATKPDSALEWWKTVAPNVVPLRTRDESPFRYVAMDSHEIIKP